MTARSTEKALGDAWATLMREGRTGVKRPAYVQKLDASRNTGLPDWLVVGASGIMLVEAKVALRRGRYAYTPKQLRAAQRYTLDVVARHGGQVAVLVLDEAGYALLPWSVASSPVTRTRYLRLRQPWPGRC